MRFEGDSLGRPETKGSCPRDRLRGPASALSTADAVFGAHSPGGAERVARGFFRRPASVRQRPQPSANGRGATRTGGRSGAVALGGAVSRASGNTQPREASEANASNEAP